MKPLTANELRIGNYLNSHELDVNNGVEIDVPVQTDINILFELNRGNVCNRYSPIPLTEEWLDVFEFENRGGYSFVKDDLECYKTEDSWSVYLLTNWFFAEHRLCDIEYVHQIQNIYYDIKGEELTRTK